MEASPAEIASDFLTSLYDLRMNNKPQINMLTMLASDYIVAAPALVGAIENHIKIMTTCKLPILYLIDSIVKNIGGVYISLFAQNLPRVFYFVFEQSSDEVRRQMYKLRCTWKDIFPANKLHALDLLVNTFDPKWPVNVTAPGPLAQVNKTIHVNPNFLVQNPSQFQENYMREKILKEKKELLVLQKRKVELELMQTKEVLDEKQRKLESEMHSGHPLEMPRVPLPGTSQTLALSQYVPAPQSQPVPPRKNLEAISSRDPRLKSQLKTAERRLLEKVRSESRSISPKEEPSKSKSPRDKERSDKSPRKKRPRLKERERSREERKPSERDKDKRHSDKEKDDKKHSEKGKEEKVTAQKDDKKSADKEDRKTDKEKEDRKAEKGKVVRKSEKENDDKKSDKQGKKNEKDEKKSSRDHRDPKKKDYKPASKKSKTESKVPAESNVSPFSSPLKESPIFSPIRKSSPLVNSCKESQISADPEVEYEPTVMEVVNVEQQVGSAPAAEEAEEVYEPGDAVTLFDEMSVSSPEAPTSSSKRKLSDDEERDNNKKMALSTSEEKVSSESDAALDLFGDVPPAPSPPIINLLRSPMEHLGSLSPPSPASSDDLDKTLDSSKEELVIPEAPPPPIIEKQAISEDKDTDLRLLLARPSSQSEDNSEKSKSKLDIFEQGLFGSREDVDLRKNQPQPFPAMPSPPPPPFLKDKEDTPGRKSWAQIKSVEPRRERGEGKFSPRTRPERVKRVFSNSSWEEESEKSDQEQPEEVQKGNCHLMIQEAAQQLQNENIDFVQYNKMLREVMSMHEEEKLKEARRKYHNPWEEKRFPPTNQEGQFPRMAPPMYPPRPPSFGPPRGPEPRQRGGWMDPRMRPPHFRRPMGNQPPMYPPRQGNMMMRMPPHNQFREDHTVTSVPLADRYLLADTDNSDTDVINISGAIRNIRFYGDTAVVLQSWDDPREVYFQPGSRSLLVDNSHRFVLEFGGPPIPITLDGVTSQVRLGKPTRELYIDENHYSLVFNTPIDLILCGRSRTVMLEGAPPIVQIGNQRLDLVEGEVKLVVDARSYFKIYLDGKSQRFEILGEPCTLKFVNNLQTVLINGVPVPIQFGGLPVPIMFNGRQHFLRLSLKPDNAALRRINEVESRPMQPSTVQSMPPMNPPPMLPSLTQPAFSTMSSEPEPSHQLEMLASLMPHQQPQASTPNKSYYTEPSTPDQPQPPPSDKNINLGELFKKLVNIGLVSTKPAEEVKEVRHNGVNILPVDFSRPESLKRRQPGLISHLFSGIQCSSCGIRFPPEVTKMYSRHLDWHFRQNRKERAATKTPQSRNWYYEVQDVNQYKEVEDIDEVADHNEIFDEDDQNGVGDTAEELPSVPASSITDPKCTVCGDKFEEFFNHEKDEWHIRNATLVDEVAYHPMCYEDFKNRKEEVEPAPTETTEEDTPQEEVEIIDLDATQVPSPEPEPEPKPEDKEVDNSVDLTNEDSKTSAPTEEAEEAEAAEANEGHEDSDDDILQVEVIEQKIESVDLIDEEEEEPKEEGVVIPSDDEEIDFSSIKVKQEKDKFPETVDSAPSYTVSIDGNIIHEKTAPLVAPGRIKINMTRGARPAEGSQSESEEGPPPPGGTAAAADLPQPSPPGASPEPPTPTFKPLLQDETLTHTPLLNKGKEMSGLCSIM